MLKRWIKVAEDEDCVDELKIIVILCKLLPFDGQALKDTEIGKAIRRLLKFKSVSTNIESLYTEVRNLMQHWTNHVKGVIISKTSGIEGTESMKTLPTIVFSISQKLVEQRGLPEKIKPAPIMIPETPMILINEDDSFSDVKDRGTLDQKNKIDSFNHEYVQIGKYELPVSRSYRHEVEKILKKI